MINQPNPNIKPDYYVIKIIGNLDDWNFDPSHKEWVKGVYEVYVFDKNTVTYICSAEPNYWLVGVYTQFIFVEEMDQDTVNVINKEYIREQLSMVEIDNPPESDYYPCSRIDNLLKDETNFVHLYNTQDDTSLDDCYEYVSGNMIL